MEKFEIEVDVEEVFYASSGVVGGSFFVAYRKSYETAKKDGMLAVAAGKLNSFEVKRAYIKVDERNIDGTAFVRRLKGSSYEDELQELFDNPKF